MRCRDLDQLHATIDFVYDRVGGGAPICYQQLATGLGSLPLSPPVIFTPMHWAKFVRDAGLVDASKPAPEAHARAAVPGAGGSAAAAHQQHPGLDRASSTPAGLRGSNAADELAFSIESVLPSGFPFTSQSFKQPAIQFKIPGFGAQDRAQDALSPIPAAPGTGVKEAGRGGKGGNVVAGEGEGEGDEVDSVDTGGVLDLERFRALILCGLSRFRSWHLQVRSRVKLSMMHRESRTN